MNAAELRATLGGKLASLDEEIAAWRGIVDPPPGGQQPDPEHDPFTRHQSQVLRLAAFFEGVGAALAAEIAALGEDASFETARAISKKILQGHALWSYFRDKLLFRYSRHLQSCLLVADELGWACIKALLAARQEAAGSAVSKVPPLIYLGPSLSPFVFPREWSLSGQILDVSDEIFAGLIRQAPFSVVSLPYYQTRHLPEILVLAHEMGHVADFDLGLSTALDAALESIPDSAVPAAHKEIWRRCRVEAFADVFGAAAGRAAFCRTMASFLADDPQKIASERIDLGKRSKYLYPTAYLRVLLTLEVLRGKDGALPEEARKVETSWRATYGSVHHHQEYEADLPAIVAAFLDNPLAELNGKTLRSLAGLPASADAEAAKIAQKMLDHRYPPDAKKDPRILAAAAALAFYRDPQRYAQNEIEAMVLERFKEDAGNTPRSAENIAAEIPLLDRQAGQNFASLLGS